MVFFFFYCLGLPPLPQAPLSDRPTHPCSKEKCTYTCTSRDTHSQREASAHTWTRMFTDECQHSKKKKTKQTHINKYIKMKRCSGIHFPEQLFLFHWDYSTEKPNKAWNNLTREEPDSTQTHTASSLHRCWYSRHFKAEEFPVFCSAILSHRYKKHQPVCAWLHLHSSWGGICANTRAVVSYGWRLRVRQSYQL